MKFINKYLIMLASLTVIFAGCEDVPESNIDAGKPGAVSTLSGSSGALLATTDADLNVLSIDEADLTFKFDLVEDGAGVQEVILKKSLNGGTPIEVQRFSSWPFTYSIGSVDEFNSGVNPSGDLSIGDTFTYTAYMLTADGREITYITGSLSVTLNCNSNLAGVYETDCPADAGTGGPNGGRLVNVTQVEGKPGVYLVDDLSCLNYSASGNDAFICGIITDVCSTLTVSAGNDDCNLGIGTSGTGSVSVVGGVTILNVTVDDGIFSGDLTLVKQ